MKNTILILLFAFSSYNISAQCKVLVDNLSGKYSGECKKGLANGDGQAIGVDKYVGEFKKGYPNGKGVYTWANGDTYNGEFKEGKMDGYGVLKSIVDGKTVEKKGYWKYGYYGGTNKNVQVYIIKNKKYVANYSVRRIGDGSKVGFKWMKGSRVLYSMPDLTMTANNGIQSTEMTFCGFEQIKFPFTCRINFTNTDKAETMTYDCIFEFEILIPGEYEIIFND